MSENDDLADIEIARMLQQIGCENPNPMLVVDWDRISLQHYLTSAENSVLQSLKPIWDLRPESIVHNDVHPDAKAGAVLYIAERSEFVSRCGDPNPSELLPVNELLNSDKILRVVGHWLHYDALTPPIMYSTGCETFSKVDGFHRITVALLSLTPKIPFFCKDQLQMDGITPASDDLLRTARWNPVPSGAG